jgi:UDP:flavonoid glycosyltransferase YjiC (YdhE family)
MKVVFAFNSYGLGHATRTLPIVKEVLKRRHTVYIIAYGRSLDFLKKELGSKVKKYFELRDYSFFKVFGEKKFSARKFFLHSRLFIKEIKIEHKEFLKLHALQDRKSVV